MLRACVRTVSTPTCSVERDLRVRAALLEQRKHFGLAPGQQAVPPAATGPPPELAGTRGITCSPREARWIALITSRDWVSLPRQALAPNASSCAHSTGDGIAPEQHQSRRRVGSR